MSMFSNVTTRKRLVWGIMTVSVLANGFFIGMLAMNYVDPPRKGGLRGEVESIGRHLPAEYNNRLRENVRALLPEMRPQWRRVRELRREIGVEVAKPQPDRAAIDMRLQEIQTITTDMQVKVQGRIFDQLMTYPAEARQGLAREDERR